MLNDSFIDNIAVRCVFLLHGDDAASYARRRCCLVTDTLDSDPVQAVLIDLVPVKAAFLNAHETDDRTKHHNQVNVIVPDHLPEVRERVARAMRLWLSCSLGDRSTLILMLSWNFCSFLVRTCWLRVIVIESRS